jgi:RimJ/RimL family protein N-acetyltransferase
VKIEVLYIEPEEWVKYAEDSHAAVFKEYRPSSMDRISYALAVSDESGVIGYVTCRETDAESIYWQYGGVVETRYGVAAFRGFEALVENAKIYKRITTLVSNNNVGYLHLLMKIGFRVIGLRCFKNEIFLELTLEF